MKKRRVEDDEDNMFNKKVEIIQQKNGVSLSNEQHDIFRFIQGNPGNLMIDSVAGSGKTSTLIQTLWFLGSHLDILVLSFNKGVQQVLQHAVNKAAFQMGTTINRELPNCTVSTCHSHGFSALRKNFNIPANMSMFDNKFKLVDDSIKALNSQMIHTALKPWKWHMCSMLKLLCNIGVDCTPETKWSEQLIIETGHNHGVPVPTFITHATKKGEKNQNEANRYYFDVLKTAHEKCCARTECFDYEDMIYLPVYLDLPLSRYDVILVDEAQDLNVVQMELIRRSVKDGGRVIFVGDKHQSIYGFRGANFNAIDLISERFDVTQLPLHTCWRCPKKVIEVAQELVPKIRARENAPEGVSIVVPSSSLVDILVSRDVSTNHTVLCRTNSPLITLASDLMKLKVPCYLEACSLRESLLKLLEAIESASWITKSNMVNRANEYVAWRNKNMLELGQEAIEKNDMLESLTVIIKSIDRYKRATAMDVRKQIYDLFSTAPGEGNIKLCTIHQAKGQEYDCVYIMRTDLLPHPSAQGNKYQKQQEENLLYVAVTRSKKELYYFQDVK